MEAVMDTPSELMIFNDTKDARKFFYFYENAVTKSLPHKEKAENCGLSCRNGIWLLLRPFHHDNGPTYEAKDYDKVKEVILDKFLLQSTE